MRLESNHREAFSPALIRLAVSRETISCVRSDSLSSSRARLFSWSVTSARASKGM